MARILIVDDSEFVVNAIVKYVKEKGHDPVAKGADGNEGFVLYKEHKPDLVLLDLTMPNKSGRDCLEEIMEFDEKARVIIISAMVSSVKQTPIVMDCLKMGARGFVTKPLRFKDPEFCAEFESEITNALE